MSDAHHSLTDQLKQAEIGKLEAETNKINKEIEALNFNVHSRPKFPKWVRFWKNLITYITMFGLFATFIGFYIQNGVVPYQTRDNIKNEITRLRQEKSQLLLSNHLDSLKDSLKYQNIELTKRQQKVILDSIKYDSLLFNFNVAKHINHKLNQDKNELDAELRYGRIEKQNISDSLVFLRNEKQQLQPFVDSLQNIANIEYRKSYNNTVEVTIIYRTKLWDYQSVIPNATIVTKYTPTQTLKFYPWHINGMGQNNYHLFPGDECDIIVKDRFKLKNEHFHFKVPENGGTFTVPVIDTKK